MSICKILYVVSHWPGAPPYGSQQRVLQIGRLLQRVGDVSIVIAKTSTDGVCWRRQTEAEFNIARVVEGKPVSRGGIAGRLRHEFDPDYLLTVPFAVDHKDREAVLDLLEQHDVAWVHTIKTANVLGIHRWPHSVLDIDDIPSRLYQSSASASVTAVRRLLDHRMSLIWKRRQRRLAERFSLMLVCSEDDRDYLGMERVRVLPNGFERVCAVERRPFEPHRIGFIGTFQWAPNVEAMQWFCKDVWPLIKRELPGARLRIAGEGTEVTSGWGDSVEGLGRIEDAASEIATWSTMVVPVRIGGGTRIKILEAFARRCPVVATTLGAFGHNLRDGEELFLADRADVFASRCIELIRSPQLATAMAARAYRRFSTSWTWDSYGDIVRAAVDEVAPSTACAIAQ
jgi:glycosyltransferase involved in cell wall biosynthesis